MHPDRVVIIGAGIAGLVAALRLAAGGHRVVVFERAGGPGGKIRTVERDGVEIDAGPTVFTMRWVFDEIFAEIGEALDDHIGLTRAEIIARHAWGPGAALDLYGDLDSSAEAIAAFAGPGEARRYRAFAARCQAVYESLEHPFLRAERPGGPLALIGRSGVGGLRGLLSGSPFATLWDELGRYFHEPRLRQLFGRYATYCGSSPFQAPALLMLIAHVERMGVWRVDGGMRAVAGALSRLASRHGAEFRYGAEADEVLVANGRAAGVSLTSGERLDADAVIVNADAAAVAGGLFGKAAAAAAPAGGAGERSLSALTWAFTGEAGGFPLLRHTVFFSADYPAEFDDLFVRRRLPAQPTIYVCAQDRGDPDDPVPAGAERLFCLVNAPATADSHPLERSEIEQCGKRMFATLEHAGLFLKRRAEMATGPTEFARAFPGTGGALYGRASHGWRASFDRPCCRTRLPGLYLAGGSTHPGPGVPMAALSGRLAASNVLKQFASTSRSFRVAMPGGTSMRSAATGSTGSP